MNKLRITLADIHSERTEEKTLHWSDFNTKIARKTLLIGIVLTANNQFSGLPALLSYSAFIFKESGSNLSPNESTIIIGAVLVIGSIFATYLADSVGRKVNLCHAFNNH